MLKVLVTNLDEVEEAYRGLYEEKDGKFYLKLDGVANHPQVVQMKTAMDRKEAERNTAKQELAALKEKIGGDLPTDWSMDEWLRLKALEDEIDPNDPEGKKKKHDKENERLAALKSNYETQIANLKVKYSTDIAAKDATIDELNKARGRDKAEIDLDSAMDKANIDPKFRPAVRALHSAKIQFDMDDEKNIRTFFKTDLGEASVMDYISTWSNSDDGKIYVSLPTGPDPSGKRNNQNTGGGTNPFSKEHWNKTEQARLRSDAVKLNRLAQAAGFKDGATALAATHALG